MKKEGQAARYVQTIHAAMRKTMESHLFTGEVSRREFVSMLCKVNLAVVVNPGHAEGEDPVRLDESLDNLSLL